MLPLLLVALTRCVRTRFMCQNVTARASMSATAIPLGGKTAGTTLTGQPRAAQEPAVPLLVKSDAV